MKVIVIGAAGAMASVAIRDLLESVEDVSITAADTRPLSFHDPRIQSVIVDVRDERATTKIVEGHDVLLNCVTYYLNVPVMNAALAARVPYVDLGGLYHGTRKQFELHESYDKAGVTAVLGMGSTPGITNVMAASLTRGMDEVHELHIRVGCQDRSASGPLPVPYALDTLLDEFAMEPMIFAEGQPQAVPPMSGEESIDFPPPAGKMTAIYTLHSEVAMFPRSFPKLKEASFKVAFPPEFTEKMRFLVQLGFASREPVIADVSPRRMLVAVAARQIPVEGEPQDCDVLRVIAKGTKENVPVSRIAESVILPHPVWKIAAGSVDTGVPLSIVGQMLARREIKQPGILCPEMCVPIEPFFDELTRRHITVRTDE